MESEKIIGVLKKCELFSHFTDDELFSIAGMGNIEEYNTGDEIFKSGNTGTKLYILSEGLISLYRNIRLCNNQRGAVTVYEARETPLRRLLGSWCSLIGEPHVLMCTARCEKPSKVIAIPADELRTFLEKNIEIRVKFFEKLVLLLKDRLESSYSSMQTL